MMQWLRRWAQGQRRRNPLEVLPIFLMGVVFAVGGFFGPPEAGGIPVGVVASVLATWAAISLVLTISSRGKPGS
jgi:hypothetical protein